MSREKLLSAMEGAVGRAAELLLRGVKSGKKLTSHRKEDHSLVTELDLELHRFLLSELSSVLPCVSEEDRQPMHSLALRTPILWWIHLMEHQAVSVL